MNLFTKKKPNEQPNIQVKPTIAISIDELPSEALEITYRSFMEQYEKTLDPLIQQKLVFLSKIMTDRAYTYGNGEAKDYFIKRGKFTEEKWNSLSKEEKETLKTLKIHMEELDKKLIELTTPEPERFELIIKNEIEPTDEPKKSEPKEKKKFSLFKKKVPVETVEIPVHDDVVQTIEKIKQEQPEIFKKQVTPEQKERAKKMEEATIKKHKIEIKPHSFFKKDKEKKQKLNLPDVYCPDCSHSIKDHQSKGVSVGCGCGCLNTIEVIAEKHGVQLYEPKEVLEKISGEHEVIQETISEEIGEIPDEEIQDIIKHAEMINSMKPKTDKTELQIPKPIEQSQSPIATMKQSLCANCDHVPNLHFEKKEFCTVIGCTCGSYRSYPE